MGHKVGDALEHAAWLEHEGREGHLGEVHADSARAIAIRRARVSEERAGTAGGQTHLSCEMREVMMEPSFSSLSSQRSGGRRNIGRAKKDGQDGCVVGLGVLWDLIFCRRGAAWPGASEMSTSLAEQSHHGCGVCMSR